MQARIHGPQAQIELSLGTSGNECKRHRHGKVKIAFLQTADKRPSVLAASTANDGSSTVTWTTCFNEKARLKVEAVEIFLDIMM